MKQGANMKMHFSFDFWNTLGEFNSKFSQARVACFARHMNLPEHEAKAHYIAVKRYVDGEAERTGLSFDSVEVFDLTLTRVNLDSPRSLAKRVHDEVQLLALENPPILRADTIAKLHEADKAGLTISITSNTNYVNGETLRRVLDDAGVPYMFGLFSDELPIAKPSPLIFDMVKARVSPGTRILHFGDHPICDVQGANDAGIEGVLVSYENLAQNIEAVLNHEPA
jgi:FMN phosphatase YigB (HAD superfamily)